MKCYYSLSIVFLFCLSAFAFTGCSATIAPSQTEESKTLANISTNVILAIYSDVNTKASDLLASVKAFKSSQTQPNLDAAKAAWKAARKPFEMAEAFEYGPLVYNDLQKKLDNHPFSETEFDSIMKTSGAFDIPNVSKNIRGFHAIEYILWGKSWDDAVDKQVGEFTPREFEYLEAVTTDFTLQTDSLYQAWAPSGKNYLRNFTDAGKSGSSYVTEKAALQEIMEGIIVRSEELGDELLASPYTAQDPRQQESLYSNNSTNDFSDIASGIQSVYTGAYGLGSEEGLSHLVKVKDAVLDASVRSQIADCITKINALLPNFTAIVKNHDPKGQASIDAVQRLHRVLEDSVKVVLNLN